MNEAREIEGRKVTVAEAQAGNGPPDVGAGPALQDPVGDGRARLRALIAEAVARSGPIEDARRPLESIVEVSVRLKGGAEGDELVVVDEGGQPRTKPSSQGPAPFTVDDLLADMRAIHPTLFRRSADPAAPSEASEPVAPPAPASRDWLRLGPARESAPSEQTSRDAAFAPPEPAVAVAAAPTSASHPGPDLRGRAGEWAGSLAAAFRSQVEAVRSRAPGVPEIRDRLAGRGAALRTGLDRLRNQVGERVQAARAGREAQAKEGAGLSGSGLKRLAERGAALLAGFPRSRDARPVPVGPGPGRSDAGPVPPAGPDLAGGPRSGSFRLPRRPMLAAGGIAAALLLSVLAFSGGGDEPAGQAAAPSARAETPSSTGSVNGAPRTIDGALRGAPEVVDTATLNFNGKVARLFGVEWTRGAGEPEELRSYLAGREVTCLPTTVAGKFRCSVGGQDLSRVVLFNGGGRTTVEATPELKAAEERARQAKAGHWGRNPSGAPGPEAR